MTARSWMRALFGRQPIASPYCGDMIRTRRLRLALEVLEERTLLSGMPSVTLELLAAPGSSLPAVTLGLDSYQFGFKHATIFNPGGGGAGAGKTTFDDLEVSSPLSELSPLLFGVLTSGSHYPTAVLTQRNAAGDPVAEWVMGTVLITSDIIHNNSAAVPTEELHLAFGALTEVTSAHAASWSQITGSSNGPTAPNGIILAELLPVAAPALTLELHPSAGQPPVTLALDSYHFGVSNLATIIDTDGLVDSQAFFQDLEVSAPLSGVAPQMIGLLTTGTHFTTAVLTQRDAAGNPVAEWVMGNGSLTSDVIAGGGTAVPTEALHVAFDSVTEVTSAQSTSWNQSTNSNNGPAAPAGVTLSALPTLVAPALTLTLKPFSNSDVLAFTLGLKSYQFDFGNDQRIIDPATGGFVAGKFFQDLEVSAPLSGASPVLFFSLFGGGHYGTAVLTQRNADGAAVAEWILGSVSPISDDIAGSGSAVPTEKLKLLFGSVTTVTSAHAASWNQFTNSNNGPAAPPGVTLAALPTLSAPALTLELKPSLGSSLPALSLGPDSFEFGFVSQGPVGVITNGGRAFFEELDIVAPLSGASPRLFAALAAGSHYSTAVLTQRDAAGDPVAEWVLGNVILTFDDIAGGGSGVPTETLGLLSDTVTEVTSAQTASWNQITDSATAPRPRKESPWRRCPPSPPRP
jgi:type VI protein secretion system component Hcp